MGDVGPGRGCGDGAAASVTKNIKYLYFCAVKLFKLIHDPQPVEGLFGEYPDMPEPCGLDFKGEVVELKGPPIFREFGEKLPLTAGVFALKIFIFPLCLFPLCSGKRFGPDGLRRGTDEPVRAELLELLQVPGVEQLVVELIEWIALCWRMRHECV